MTVRSHAVCFVSLRDSHYSSQVIESRGRLGAPRPAEGPDQRVESLGLRAIPAEVHDEAPDAEIAELPKVIEEAKGSKGAQQGEASLTVVLQAVLTIGADHFPRARLDFKPTGKKRRSPIDGKQGVERLDGRQQMLEVGAVVLQREEHALAARLVEEERRLGVEDVEGYIGDEHLRRVPEQGKVGPVPHNPAAVTHLLAPSHLIPEEGKLPFLDHGWKGAVDALLAGVGLKATQRFQAGLEEYSLGPDLEGGTQEARIVDAEVQGWEAG